MSLFNTVKIQTPESVELEFTLAGIGNRALALLIDYLALLLLSAVIFILSSLIRDPLVGLALWLGGSEGVEGWLRAIAFLALFTLYIGYFVGFEILWQGQTPGKRWVNIRVIGDNGQPAGVWQVTLRALMRPVDDIIVVGFVGFFCILLSSQEKRIGDWLAGTLVVQNERPILAETLQIDDAAKTLADKLLQSRTVDPLLPDDFSVIRAYLQRRPLMAKAARDKLSLTLAKDLRQILGWDTLPSAVTPDRLIEAVYWAYQQDRGRYGR